MKNINYTNDRGHKYKIYVTGTQVIAVSTYAGKFVKGIAKLDPRDDFDLGKGIDLAVLRCELKVAKKRADRANQCVSTATDAVALAQRKQKKMLEYLKDANTDYDGIKLELEKLLEKI